jgi:adenylate cyclase class 2
VRLRIVCTRLSGEARPIPKEIEVKLKFESAAVARKKLARIGAKPVPGEVAAKDGRYQERNILFDTPDGGFARHGQLLRVRIESTPTSGKKAATRVLLTYKGPAEPSGEGRYKIRQENEVVVADVSAITSILEALGLRGWFRYEKFRTRFALSSSKKWAAGLHLELDETPVGVFLELEGPTSAIDRAAGELGFSPRNYITKNYLLLHMEDYRRKGLSVPQLAPGIIAGIPDMVFPESPSKKR